MNILSKFQLYSSRFGIDIVWNIFELKDQSINELMKGRS